MSQSVTVDCTLAQVAALNAARGDSLGILYQIGDLAQDACAYWCQVALAAGLGDEMEVAGRLRQAALVTNECISLAKTLHEQSG